MILHFQKRAGPKVLLFLDLDRDNLGNDNSLGHIVTAIAGTIAPQTTASINVSRLETCTWNDSNAQYSKFQVEGQLALHELELADETMSARFSWRHERWAASGKCECRCVNEAIDVFKTMHK